MLVPHNPLSLLIQYHPISRIALADYLGISLDTLYFYESDGIDIPDEILDKICTIFNISKLNYISWRG